MDMEKKVLDAEAANSLVDELRSTFASGKTRSYKWRVSQLKSLLSLANTHESDIIHALRSDLAKPELESIVYEISLLKSSCKLALSQLKRWMKPETAKTGFQTFPSSANIVSEPLGVVLVISAWNYPFLLSLDPVVGAIAAGCAVVVKPSEISPATSSLLAKLAEKYHGKFSFDAFSHKKAVVYRSFAGDSSLRYPPYSKKKMRLMEAVFSGGMLEVIRVLFGCSWSL